MSADDLAVDRLERAKVYFEAVSPYDIRDIEAAAQSFITGSAPGHNPAYAPSAPQVGAEVRRLMNLRVTSEERDRRLRPALPPPDIERTPESRARVGAMVASVVGNLQSSTVDDREARHRAQIQRGNDYFDAQRGFSVGDPDADADMGNAA